jgi:anti-sigma B factor antagonist
MDITFHPGNRPDQLVVAPSGDLDLYASVAFANAVMAKLNAGSRRIVLDFSRVRYLDSSGVGAVIRLLQMARTLGGELRAAGLTGTPRKVLEMSNIISLLKVSPSVEHALQAWG